jgi:hypothetical protein
MTATGESMPVQLKSDICENSKIAISKFEPVTICASAGQVPIDTTLTNVML